MTASFPLPIINDRPGYEALSGYVMINFLCSNCGAPLRIPPEKAGSTGKCPRCGRYVEAPLESGSDRGSGSGPRAREGKGTFEAAGGREELDFLTPSQGADEIGRLGNYRVQKVLGSGGMGVVLLAEDLKLRRAVALKVMKRAQAANPIHRERFVREAQAAAAIEHDNIVPIYQVDEDRGVPFLAMKLLVGESLEDRLNREGTLPAESVIRIGMEIAEGLAAAHERGLIHRDIKPANIWLEEGKDRVKIVDFGLAQQRNEDNRLTAENYLVGTPMYMSPEQASGDIPLDQRTDLFSLGSVLYRMSTGELPFKGKTTINVLTALATKRPRPPCELNDAIPRDLSALIMQLLQKRPDDRPKTARMVVAALTDIRDAPPEEVIDTVTVEEEETTRSKETPRPRLPRRKPVRQRRRLTNEEQLTRRVIRFAIVAGVFVFLLLAFLIIKNKFFKSTDETPPQNPPQAPAGL